jgi:hypothetical protein
MWMTLATAAGVLLVLQALVVALVSWLRPRGNVYVTIIVVSVLTAPLGLLIGTHHLGAPLGADGQVYWVLTHLALGGFLFHFMTLPDRSVTLRILVEILLAPGQALSTTALGSRYGVKIMITSRLEQLSAGQFLAIAPDGHITLTRKGLAFGRFVTAGRKLFGIASAN